MNIYNEIVEKECPYCKKIFEGKHSNYANHVRWCKDNPDYEKNRELNGYNLNNLKDKKFGEFRNFNVKCEHCGKEFIVTEREKLFPKKKKYFCSRSCANSRERSDEVKQKISNSVRKTFQENLENGIVQDHIKFDPNNLPFHIYHHITWDNNQVFLRSSYEEEYALFLDSQKIHYEVEKLRIIYFDNIKQRLRYSKPDFFIPETNTIIEIKSCFTYKYQNMLDKTNEYVKQGYNVKLVLDKEEFDIKCPEIDLPEQRQKITIYEI